MAEPLEEAAALVGDRWTLLVCDALRTGPLRFADLATRVEGVSPNVLTRRLRDLEAAGVVAAEPYSDRPVRHRYRLTPLGRELGPALGALGRWGEQVLAARERLEADAGDTAGGAVGPRPTPDGDRHTDGDADDDGDELRYA